MHTTIILAHPWHGSFNKAILDSVVATLEQQKREYVVIDLNKEDFNPVLTESELALFSKGECACESVERYQQILKDTNHLVMIFPIWWFDPPAILKGFFDKVMLANFAYVKQGYRMVGQLTQIEQATVITTSEVPTFYLKYVCGNPIGNAFIKGTLRCIGVKHTRWFNCGFTASGSDAKRQRFMNRIARHFSR